MPTRNRFKRLFVAVWGLGLVGGLAGSCGRNPFAPQARNQMRIRSQVPVPFATRPMQYLIPALPNSLRRHGRGAIVGVVLDAITGAPAPGAGTAIIATRNYNALDAVFAPRVGVSGYVIANLPPDSFYAVRCVSGERTGLVENVRIVASAVDTVICRLPARAQKVPIRAPPAPSSLDRALARR